MGRRGETRAGVRGYNGVMGTKTGSKSGDEKSSRSGNGGENPDVEHFAVLGTGAMATVCARVLVQNGHRVRMWGHAERTILALRADREQKRLLPGTRIPDEVELTADDSAVFSGCTMVLSAVPTQYARSAWQRVGSGLPEGVPVVSVAKGVENGSLLRPTEVLGQVLSTFSRVPHGLAVLSGPNIAAELGRNQTAMAVVASADGALAKRVQHAFSTTFFRVYTNPDLIGVEVAGATKNIIAIAAGILDGMSAGNNAKAALVTRGLVEITRLGLAMGAREETFQGLAGLGDLITTCVSPEGRNRSVGERIGRGESLAAILASMSSVAEGVATTKSVVELATRYGVEMPISRTLYAVLFEGMPAKVALGQLMTRERKAER